jgi:hypothetical protein
MEVTMKWMSALLLAGLSACSAQPTSAPPPPLVAAGAQVNCIDLKQVTGRHVLPPSAVLFDMVGAVSYRNDLQGSCPSAARADPSAIIQTESQSTQLCRDDRIRIYDPVEAKATGARSFPECRIGAFTAVPTR